MLNKMGPITEPCGTPLRISLHFDLVPLIYMRLIKVSGDYNSVVRMCFLDVVDGGVKILNVICSCG